MTGTSGTELAPVAPVGIAAGGCLDEGTVLRFFGGGLSAERMADIERHIDGCSSCGSLIQAAAPVVAGTSGAAGLGRLPELAEPGRVLAERYRLEKLIGWGATGFVFRAQDQVTSAPVAVKMLRDECAAQPAWLDRLTRELKVARALMHPNVGRVFDLTVDRQSGQPRFLVMELASGSLLDELRDEVRDETRGARTFTQRLRDAEGVASGLSAMHEAGILHRDLKPANLLRTGDGRLVISDFGLATSDLERATMTRFVGTPMYMAPEVATGDRATTASDIWSLGVVLHELLFGCRPRWRTTAGGRRLLSLPARVGSRLQRAAVALCGHCMSALASDRPSARQVAARLRSLAAGKLPSRRGSVLALAGLLVVSTGAGIAGGMASHDLSFTGPARGTGAPADRMPVEEDLAAGFARAFQRTYESCFYRAEKQSVAPLPGIMKATVDIGLDGKPGSISLSPTPGAFLSACLIEEGSKLRLAATPAKRMMLSFALVPPRTSATR